MLVVLRPLIDLVRNGTDEQKEYAAKALEV